MTVLKWKPAEKLSRATQEHESPGRVDPNALFMEVIMTRTRKTLIGLATIAALAASSLVYAAPPGAGAGPGACPYGGPGQGWGPGAGPGRGPSFSPAAMVDGRLAALKTELSITANQESTWQAFAGKAKAQVETMQAQRAAVKPEQTAPERLAQRASIAKQRATNIETMSAAMKDLYEALTPEQKAIADQRLAFGGMGGPGGPGRMGGRGGWR